MTIAAQIAAIKDALAKGVEEVRYDGHSVRYRSLAEMQSILAGLERQAGTRTADDMVAYPDFSRDGA